jgi:predicted O-methyltransferase YrrM
MSYLKFTPLTPKLYQYCLDMACRESKLLHEIHDINESHPQIVMQISSDQAQFLQFLIKNKKMYHILEIGTFLGYSSAAMAEALPTGGQLTTLDIDVRATDQAKQHWQRVGLTDKINLMLGPANQSLQQLMDAQQKFDLIFIDADKSNYISYFEYAKKLINTDGIIAVDNIFFHGEVCESSRSKGASYVHEFNCYIQQDSSVDISLIPLADGLLLAQLK